MGTSVFRNIKPLNTCTKYWHPSKVLDSGSFCWHFRPTGLLLCETRWYARWAICMFQQASCYTRTLILKDQSFETLVYIEMIISGILKIIYDDQVLNYCWSSSHIRDEFSSCKDFTLLSNMGKMCACMIYSRISFIADCWVAEVLLLGWTTVKGNEGITTCKSLLKQQIDWIKCIFCFSLETHSLHLSDWWLIMTSFAFWREHVLFCCLCAVISNLTLVAVVMVYTIQLEKMQWLIFQILLEDCCPAFSWKFQMKFSLFWHFFH